MKNCSQPITTRKTKKSEIKTKRSGVNSRDSIIEVFCSHRKKKKNKTNRSGRKRIFKGEENARLAFSAAGAKGRKGKTSCFNSL